MLDAFTLTKSENHSRIVLVKDVEKASGKHVSYKDYINKSSQKEGEIEAIEVIDDRHFDFVSRDNEHSVIHSIKKRYFHSMYKKSLPKISVD